MPRTQTSVVAVSLGVGLNVHFPPQSILPFPNFRINAKTYFGEGSMRFDAFTEYPESTA